VSAAGLIAEVRFAQVQRGSTASAAAVTLAKVSRKYKMTLVGNSAAAAGKNTAMSHSRHLENLTGTNMRSGVAAHKATGKYSEAQPPVATNMGYTDWKTEVDMVLKCPGLVGPHMYSFCWDRTELALASYDLRATAVVLRPWQNCHVTSYKTASPESMIAKSLGRPCVYVCPPSEFSCAC
jgi:hypothetical protein